MLKYSLSLLRNISNHCNITKKMSGQVKISQFFQPMGQKRGNVSDANADKGNVKKAKLDQQACSPPKKENQENQSSPAKKESSPQQSPASVTLSPEQKSKISSSKMAAKMKLAERKTNGLVENMGASWFEALEPEFSKPYFEKLSAFIAEERKKSTIFPPADQVFTFTTACDINKVKVVMLGQDPYHDNRQAHGLCFSVQSGVKPPPSLVNIYKELEADIEGFKHPGHGYLEGWANQGVLLLNAVLTVRAHNANSHKDKGWEKLTDAVIAWINTNLSGVVFMLWGAYAQKKGAGIDKKKHHVLKSVHPSPLSAHRGFIGCRHFSQCNTYLQGLGKEQIDWTRLPKQK